MGLLRVHIIVRTLNHGRRPATETEASLSLVVQYGTVCQLHCGVMMWHY